MPTRISTNIFAGNMGFGWKDETLAAIAYALFTREYWNEKLGDLTKQGHRITIEINVKRGYTGFYAPVDITTQDFDLRRATALRLPDEAETWKAFVDEKKSDRVLDLLVF